MSAPRPIALASDHAGAALRALLRESLRAEGRVVVDLGAEGEASVDYPDYAHALATALLAGRAGLGVLVCGSGIGMSIAANRHRHIRCALVHDVTGARLARAHNDANVIAFGARLIGPEVALESLRVFLSTPFEGGRHARRLAKLTAEPAP